MRNLSDELKDIRENVRSRGRVSYPHDWKQTLPEGSQWFPGSQGQPGCKVCNGLGWLRREISQYDKSFGKLILCECVPHQDHIALDMENEKIYGRQS
jgi:hypothetical protein